MDASDDSSDDLTPQSWACMIIDRKKVIIKTKLINKFDPKCYDKQKKYYAYYEQGYKQGVVTCVADSKEAVREQIKSQRLRCPSTKMVKSASELSELADSQPKTKKKKTTDSKKNCVTDKNFEMQLEQIKVQSLKRKYQTTSSSPLFKNKDENKGLLSKINVSKDAESNKVNGDDYESVAKKRDVNPKNRPSASSTHLLKQKDQNKGLIPKNDVHTDAEYNVVYESVVKIGDNDSVRNICNNCLTLKEKHTAEIYKMNQTMEKLESQLREKNVNEQRQTEQIKELTVKNLSLESDMIKRIKQLTEMMSKNTPETESNGGMACGYEDTKLSKVYLGPEVWIESRIFKSLLRNNKYSLFVKQLCRYLFGEETIKKSTVTGKTSNRKRKICKDKKEELVHPEQLDPILISIVRDSLKYYFRYKGVTDEFKINRGIANIPRLIAILSSDLKKPSKRPACKKTPEATASMQNKANFPDNIVEKRSEKISDDDSEYTDNNNDYESDTESENDNDNEYENDNDRDNEKENENDND